MWVRGKKMPRPGPRPYECVRRAWHSDRHQPMRGSITQQIFRYFLGANCILCVLLNFVICKVLTICLIRVVIERHSVVTKKNREWQQKLPVVVLKAEEIMYSKANSEVFCFFSLTWGMLNLDYMEENNFKIFFLGPFCILG